MKRLNKIKSKKGFTLLEVLLATVIMSIVSLMIMKGFLATMKFAHNNKLYAKSGTANYANCMKFIARNANEDLQTRIVDNETSSGGVLPVVHFSPASAGEGDGEGEGEGEGETPAGNTAHTSFSIRVVPSYEVSLAAPVVNVSGEEVPVNEYEENGVNHHRRAFFYQPKHVFCSEDESHVVRICYVEKTGTIAWYCTSSECPNAVYNNPIEIIDPGTLNDPEV